MVGTIEADLIKENSVIPSFTSSKMEDNVKAKSAPRVKEKRQPHNQDSIPKKMNKHQGLLKNDSQPPQPPQPQPSCDSNSPVKKIFNEASKIVKLGMEKEFALLERDTILQNSNETIDNLRKNMLHLQMEYEKLDQNFQREISYRTEIVKRMDATRELVESVVQCSNVLSSSLKQLEEDKLKIAEYYELIYQKQKEAEAKHNETEKFIKQHDELLKVKMQEINKFQCKIMSQNSETISQLSKKLTHSNDKLKMATDENENLQRKIQDLQESSARLQAFLEQQERLNCLHQENVTQFKQNLKKLKIQRGKCQKLLNNKKKQLCAVVRKNKNLEKALHKTELLYRESAQNLDSKESEWRNNFENHLEEVSKERQTWESQKEELMNRLSDKQAEIEGLKEESKLFNSRILELTTKEAAKEKELEEMQNDLSKMLSENLKLKEDLAKVVEENGVKVKIISELEMKSDTVNAGLNSQVEFYRNECEKLAGDVNKLESQLFHEQEKLAFEKAQNKREISDLNRKLEKRVQESNKKIFDLEKLLEEKAALIEKLENEETESAINGKAAFEKLNNELQAEKSENKELLRKLQILKENQEDVSKQLEEAQKQISGLKGNLTDLSSTNETLTRNQEELEKNSEALKKELEVEKKRFKALEEKQKKAEKELAKMEKLVEENTALKSTTTELKNHLEGTEVRLEAYKVAVKKLESEKAEAKNSHSEEVSKLKMELKKLEEANIKDKTQLQTPQKGIENTQNKREPGTPSQRAREKLSSSRILSVKENEPEVVGTIEKWHQASASPLQSGKKFLSTPRKIITSTPQASFRNVTPMQKKRDPYEFDSDSSVERFDQDKVLKVFNRQKRETTNKRSKTNK